MIKTKRGVFFYPFFIVFSIILAAFFVFFVLGDIEKGSFNAEEELAFDLSYLSLAFEIENFYFEHSIQQELEERKRLAPSQLLFSRGGIGQCRKNLEGENFFVFYTEDVSEDEESFCFRNTVNKDEDESKIEDLLWERLTFKLEEVLQKLFIGSHLYSSFSENKEDLKIEIDEERRVLSYSFGRDLSLSPLTFDKQRGIVSYRKTFLSKEEDFSSYLNLFSFLEEKLLLLSTHMEETQSCSTDTVSCLKNYLESEMSEELKEDYELSFEKLEVEEETEYLYFILKINEKETSSEFEFLIVLENRLSLGEVEFELDQFQAARETVKLSIVQPQAFADSIEQYLVVYANFDFFEGEEAQAFKDELRERGNPALLEISSKPALTLEDLEFAVSGDSGVAEVSYVLTTKHNFEKRDNKVMKDLIIYQIYNYDEDRFELLDSNKEYFFYVFALDKRQVFFLNSQQETKSIELEELFSPLPIGHEVSSIQSSFTVELFSEGASQEIEIELSNYLHENYDHFDIYITKDRERKGLRAQCEGVEFDCYHFDGSGILRKTSNFQKRISLEESSDSISASSFSHSFSDSFRKGGTFELLLVPVDENGNAVLEEYQLRYAYEQNDDEALIIDLNSLPQRLRYQSFTLEPTESPPAEENS